MILLARSKYIMCLYAHFVLYYAQSHITLSHTVPTFNDPNEEGFGKHCGKGRKCW